MFAKQYEPGPFNFRVSALEYTGFCRADLFNLMALRQRVG